MLKDMSDREARYTIGELARLGGVSRRTVRYYVQRELLPQPLGRGRGGHYDDRHLQRLLRIRTLQEQGCALDEIRDEITGKVTPDPGPAPAASAVRPTASEARASEWIRLELAQGVELHLDATGARPGPRAARELRAAVMRILGDDFMDDPGAARGKGDDDEQ